MRFRHVLVLALYAVGPFAAAADYVCGPLAVDVPYDVKVDGPFPVVEVLDAGIIECRFVASKDDRVTLAIDIASQGSGLGLTRRDEAVVQRYFARSAQWFHERPPPRAAGIVGKLEERTIGNHTFTCFPTRHDADSVDRWTGRRCFAFSRGTKVEIWYQVPEEGPVSADTIERAVGRIRWNET